MIKGKLPTKVRGEELVKIISESLNSIGAYRTGVELIDGHYEPGSVKFKETRKLVLGVKGEAQRVKSILWNTLTGGIMSKTPLHKIKTYLDLNEEYDTITLEVTHVGDNGNTKLNAENLHQYPTLQREIETMLRSVYTQLGHPA